MTASGPGDVLVWITIVAIAAGTWAFRASFVFLFGYIDEVPPRVDRILRLIPPALLAAIVAPELLLEGDGIAGLGNDRLLAGVVGLAVAWYTENMLATIAVGMVALWVLVFFV